MVSCDLGAISAELRSYARLRLYGIDVKQLEGRTPDDIVQDTLLKVLEGGRVWETSSAQNFRNFLFGCLRSEISNILVGISRRQQFATRIEEKLYSISYEHFN